MHIYKNYILIQWNICHNKDWKSFEFWFVSFVKFLSQYQLAISNDPFASLYSKVKFYLTPSMNNIENCMVAKLSYFNALPGLKTYLQLKSYQCNRLIGTILLIETRKIEWFLNLFWAPWVNKEWKVWWWENKSYRISSQ